jgi:Holliday junction resolvasome RuvABC endonuclease subunit
MGIKSLVKRDAKTVLGVDASTNSFAFCLYGPEGPIRWGEITFKGATVFERLSYGQARVNTLKEYFEADLVVFESAVFVQNKKTVIMLAYAFGAIISALMQNGSDVKEISPLEWQRAIKNPPLTKIEKDQIIKDNPDKSKSWYQNKNREFRKARTIQWVKNEFGIEVESDNVSDAIAIASVGYSKFAQS